MPSIPVVALAVLAQAAAGAPQATLPPAVAPAAAAHSAPQASSPTALPPAVAPAAAAPPAPQASSPTPAAAVVVARQLGVVNPQVVSYVAENFEAKRLPDAIQKNLAQLSPAQVITQLCGSVQDGYYVAFEKANGGSARPRDQILGAGATSLVWPACLQVAPLPAGAKAPVTLSATGSNPFDAGLAKPKVPGLPAAFVQALTGSSPQPLVAIPTELKPMGGVSAADASANLKAFAPAAVAAAPSHTLRGHIVEEPDSGAIDPMSAAAKACPTSGGRPFDAAAVAAAFAWSAAHRPAGLLPQGVPVYVVDNGFFGANLIDTPPYSDAFPGQLFLTWQGTGGLVGPPTLQYSPINYSDGMPAPRDVTAVEGHGTHVAGLAIGGPAFKPYRDNAYLNDGRLQLTIVNLGPGQRDLIDGSETLLKGLLDATPNGGTAPKMKIVNMSLVYDTGSQSLGVFRGLFSQSETQTLFVLAAGNDHNDIGATPVYPAALGGSSGGAPNAITVAAHDTSEPSLLSWFTNFGSTAVDIAAPGCGISSWVDGAHQKDVSGTSQAAPTVTFEAGLLAMLDPTLLPKQIKQRILASGDLLGGGDDHRRNVISYSKINIPEALLLFDDVIEVPTTHAAASGVDVLIGDITTSFSLRCTSDGPALAGGRGPDNLWAFKAQGADVYLFTDRSRDGFSPCRAAMTASAPNQPVPYIEFTQRARLADGMVIPESQPSRQIPVGQLQKVLYRGPYRNHI